MADRHNGLSKSQLRRLAYQKKEGVLMTAQVRKCFCCGEAGEHSIAVVDQEGRLYLPNKEVRLEGFDADMWFCKPCMRFVEDNFRAAVRYLSEEKGLKYTRE